MDRKDSSNDVSKLQNNKETNNESLFFTNYKKVKGKDYKEKWKCRTVWMLILPFLNLGILLFLTVIETKNMSVVLTNASDFLKSGSLFTISLSLITNVFKDHTDSNLYCIVARIFCRPAVPVNLDIAQATLSVPFLAGQQNPSSLWMQTSFTSVSKRNCT